MPAGTLARIPECPADAWIHLRKEVGAKLHGNMYNSVPLLDEAKTFDMLTVYVKRSEGAGCLTRFCQQRREYQMVGWLRDLVKVSKCTQHRLQSLLPRQLPIKVGGDAVFEFTTHNVKLDREAIIRIYNLSIETADLVSIQPGEIFVDNLSPELQDVENVYILSEVIFCRRFYFFLRIAKREIILNLPYDRLPIGFRSVKFFVGQDGGLVLVRQAKVHNKASVVWSACGLSNDEVEDKPPLPLTISTLTVIECRSKMVYSDQSKMSAPCPTNKPRPHLKNPDADLSRDHRPSRTEVSTSGDSVGSVKSDFSGPSSEMSESRSWFSV